MLTNLSFSADFVLIGRILGSTILGCCGTAWDLLRFIPDRLFKVIGRVTLPLFSHFQDDDEALRRLTAMYGLLPASIGMSVVESTIVIVGQLMVNATIALPMTEFMHSLRPGIRNSIVAGIATELGRLIASASGLQGAPALTAIIILPAIAMTWLELGTLIALAKGSLSRRTLNEGPAESQAL
jgi:hypothetical protein